MKILVIIAHDAIDTSHSQQFLMASLQPLAQVSCHRLDRALGADGHFDVAAERARLAEYDRIIFQFPLYWYSAPALMKQWIDEVMHHSLRNPNQSFGLVVTLGAPLKHYQAGGEKHYTLSELLRPLQLLAQDMTWQFLPIFPVPQLAYMDEAAQQQLLVAYQYYVTATEPDSFSAKTRWLIDRLQQHATTVSVDRQQQLTLLQEHLQQLQEQLDDTMLTLAPLQEEERS